MAMMIDQDIPFTLEMVLQDPTKVDTHLRDLLRYLQTFFLSLHLRSAKITSITHSSTQYDLLNDFFDSGGEPSSLSFKSISLKNHGPNPILWKGFLQLNQADQHQMNKFIHNISTATFLSVITHTGHPLEVGLIWRFSDDLSPFFQELIAVDQRAYKLRDSQLNATSFSLGNMICGNHFVAQFTSDLSECQTLSYSIQPIRDVGVTLMHTNRHMELRFNVRTIFPQEYGCREFRLIFDYKSIKGVTVYSNATTGSTNLYFQLAYPAKIYIEKADCDRRFVYVRENCTRGQWVRWHDCFLITADMISKSSILRLTVNDWIDERFKRSISFLYVWRRYTPLDLRYANIRNTVLRKYDEFPSDLPFDVKYAIECLKSLSLSFHVDLTCNDRSFMKLMDFIRQQIHSGKTKQVVETFYRLFSVYQMSIVYHAFEHFKWLFDRVSDHWNTITNLNNLAKIKHLRRCIFTPTRVLLIPPTPFQSSFFLKSADPEFTLRVLIRDEDFSSLGFAVSQNNSSRSKPNSNHLGYRPDPRETFLKEVIENRLLNGLSVAGRLYQYFGASSSQFREAGLVLYATDFLGRTAKMIRDSFGVIDEKSVAKYSARIGLSLSQIITFVELPSSTKILLSSDVYGGRHSETGQPYNFTDGCGSISPLLARYVWNKMKEHREDIEPDNMVIPSAFQIRFMGAKGMVCIDSNLDGMAIVLRKSMLKMKGVKKELGIVKVGEPRKAYLNAPFISILNQIGLESKFFVNLLMEQISSLIASFDNNKDAISALKMFSYLHRFVDFESLAKADFQLHCDPFFRSILTLVFNHGLDIIKRKARIPLPLEDARTVFGVSDPTVDRICPRQEFKFNERNVCIPPEIEPCYDALGKGLLKRGEVFVWPSDFDKPYVGELIVTKFPSTHPGDVRRLVAMDHKELHDIRDCIVFPVDGDRPHCDEMAGSDYDGDEYCVIWADQFKRVKISMPMEYPSCGSESNSYIISDKELINFHMQYLRECDVGRIAKAHLAWSDLTGIDSDKCICLAKKIAATLDFAKQGIDDKYRFQKDDNYPEAPDFMEKHESKPAYHSTRALGILYQIMSQFQLCLADEIKVKQLIEPHIDTRLEHPQWRLFEKSAEDSYSKYEAIVEHLLQRCDFADEAELLSQVFEKNCLFRQSSEEGPRSNDYEDSISSIIKNILVKEMECDFDRDITFVSDRDFAEARMAKASAFYMVTLNKAIDDKMSKLKCFGLPWIGNYSKFLRQLLNRNMNASQPQPLIERRPELIRMGFTGDNVEQTNSREAAWTKLHFWITKIFDVNNVTDYHRQNLYAQMLQIFNYAIQTYCSGVRMLESSGKVFLKIFELLFFSCELQEFKYIESNNSKTYGLFSKLSNPIGQMVIALLEQEFSINLMKTSRSFTKLSTSRCFVVRAPKEEIEDELKVLIPHAEIIGFGHSDQTFLTVFAPPASLLVAQIVIGVRNRLGSIKLDVMKAISIVDYNNN